MLKIGVVNFQRFSEKVREGARAVDLGTDAFANPRTALPPRNFSCIAFSGLSLGFVVFLRIGSRSMPRRICGETMSSG